MTTRSESGPMPQTHQGIDRSLSGTPVAMSPGRARLRLLTTSIMVADDTGLVHGGFVFSLADHAAMLAVDEPTVVLGAAECRFLRPVCVGETLEAEAALDDIDGKKHPVHVVIRRVVDEEEGVGDVVFEGVFTCFVPPRHVLAADG